MQEGLFSLARDFDHNVYRNGMYAHAALGKAFGLPVVMTSSSQTGPNGPLPDEFLQWYPDAPLIQRQGEVDAWDNPQFREAVIAANKSQIILGGITTDVCRLYPLYPFSSNPAPWGYTNHTRHPQQEFSIGVD